MIYDLVVVGGGAAGFFGAIQTAEHFPGASILILEKSNKLLSKVKVSGGGRCNVTHACFTPSEMIAHYPRGSKELLGPFHQFLCGDMMEWLENNNVSTKIEEDGRVFPLSDSSQSIIDCFLWACQKHSINIEHHAQVQSFKKKETFFELNYKDTSLQTKSILWTTGSSPKAWDVLKKSGLCIIDPVPSLFTFNIQSALLDGLMGLSLTNVQVQIQLENTQFDAQGPLLITHWGLSGPAVLKLSAWAARELHAVDYNFQISVNWIAQNEHECLAYLNRVKSENGKLKVKKLRPFQLPRRLWERMVSLWQIEGKNMADLSNSELEQMASDLSGWQFNVNGKSTFKEEFVTCGGVDLKEINFKHMESKKIPGLYLAGEVINIDAITGGFNFQAAWTESFIAGRSIAERIALNSEGE
ncbi:MAG: NAD(P)/FAD-dependent oxidoreductase [Bacteroidota bacterium]